MEKQEFRIIRIDWKKVDYLQSVDAKENRFDCLYQAYGDSPIYGRDCLLYVGQTNNFIRRTKEHLKSDFERINNPSYYVGMSKDFPIGRANGKNTLLDVSESLLITMLKPSYNSSSVKDIPMKAKKDKYLILNQGHRGVIPLEVSNIWW